MHPCSSPSYRVTYEAETRALGRGFKSSFVIAGGQGGEQMLRPFSHARHARDCSPAAGLSSTLCCHLRFSPGLCVRQKRHIWCHVLTQARWRKTPSRASRMWRQTSKSSHPAPTPRRGGSICLDLFSCVCESRLMKDHCSVCTFVCLSSISLSTEAHLWQTGPVRILVSGHVRGLFTYHDGWEWGHPLTSTAH